MSFAPVKVSLKVPFPKESTGRLLDSLTDIIRPFTEARGLRADQIRLQRAEVALKIVQIASKKIETDGARYHAVPTKGLVPFLERASLEEPGDRRMISMWANLLVSAATTRFSNLARYTAILSEMDQSHAKLLERIIFHGDRGQKILNPKDVEDSNYESRTYILSQIQREKFSAAELLDFIVGALDGPGCALKVAETEDLKDRKDDIWPPGKIYSWPNKKTSRRTVWRDSDELNYNILRSLGLVERSTIRQIFKNCELDTTYYWVTRLGYDLFLQCNPDVRQSWKERGWASID